MMSIFRPVNLLLIALTQSLVAYKYLVFTQFYWVAYLIITLLLAAAGYVINDIYDLAIDQVNKPHKVMIGQKISLNRAWQFYFALNLAALLLMYLADAHSIIMIVVVMLALYFYAHSLKKLPFIGNFLVAALSAYSVIFPVLMLTHNSIDNKLLFFTFFAFTTSLFREIVKTIEDMEGDKQGSCHTLPIILGVGLTKKFLYVLIILMLCFLGYSWQTNFLLLASNISIIAIKIYQLNIFLFLILLLYKVFRATTKKHFYTISVLTKLLMLLGLLGLLIK